MAYFPMFVELQDKNILIVGGGKVALRKLEKLLPYGARISVAAPEIDEALLQLNAAEYIFSPFEGSLLSGQDMVIAATNNKAVNGQIAALCRELHIPVNVVDDRDECSFIFPSLVKRGQLSIGISTGGASPSAAIWCRERIEDMIPEEMPQIIEQMETLRPLVMERFDTESRRSRVFKKLFLRSMQEGRCLEPHELEHIIGEAENGK